MKYKKCPGYDADTETVKRQTEHAKTNNSASLP